MNKISKILKKINEINFNQGIFILQLRCKKKGLTIIKTIIIFLLAISTYLLENVSSNVKLTIWMIGILIVFAVNII